MINTITFDSGAPGTHLLVLGAVHGNEVAGPNAIFKIIDDIQTYKIHLKTGRITFVPICNLQAYDQDVRQIEENLNRIIKYHKNPTTYEQKLANEIVPLIEQCDALLDLHSTHCPGDVPFVFCDYPTPENMKMINALDVNYVLLGWPQIYVGCSDISDYSTERCAFECHKAGITLECGYHKESDSVTVAYNAIMNLLTVFCITEGNNAINQDKTPIIMAYYIGTLCLGFNISFGMHSF